MYALSNFLSSFTRKPRNSHTFCKVFIRTDNELYKYKNIINIISK